MPYELQGELNRLAGTFGYSEQGAANIWAGLDSGVALPEALRQKALQLGKSVPFGTPVQGVMNAIANTTGFGAAQSAATLSPTVTVPTVRTSSTAGTTSAVGSLNITLPAGIVTGDLIVLFCATRNPTTTWTDPSGWTVTGGFGGSNASTRVYTKYSTNGASDSSSVVTIDPAGTAAESIIAVVLTQGTVNASSPTNQIGTSYVEGGTTLNTATQSVTTRSANNLVLIAALQNNGSTTTQTFTTPGGWTSVASQFGHNGTTGLLLQVFRQTQATAGATASPTVVSTVSNTYGPSQTLAIRGYNG